MAAPVGNKFWERRSSHGRNPKFDNPDDLWDACCQYFDWVEENPLSEDKVFSFQGHQTHEPMAKMRAMTVEGLCIFIGVTSRTWRDWGDNRDDLIPVITQAEAVMRVQKFTGAAADLLNPNIIARDLGLADKTETDHGMSDPMRAVFERIAKNSTRAGLE